MAQLAEGSLPIPEARGSNPDISRFLFRTFFYCQVYNIEKTNIKRGREFHIKKEYRKIF